MRKIRKTISWAMIIVAAPLWIPMLLVMFCYHVANHLGVELTDWLTE